VERKNRSPFDDRFGFLSVFARISRNVCAGKLIIYEHLRASKIARNAGEIEMIAGAKRETHQNDNRRRKRCRQEKALDDALENTFPASDPVSVEQPTPPARDRATNSEACGSDSDVPGKGRSSVQGGVLPKKGR
jgi:hypothetical protein